MIYLTEKAAKQIKIIADSKKIGHYTLRVKVKGGACVGFQYDLSFDDQFNESDQIFEFDGTKLICDSLSIRYMDGTTIDYDNDSLMGTGFKFKNPISIDNCGCGKSFAI